MEIVARNVSVALSEGLNYLRHAGVQEQSRNGPVLVAPGPVMTSYTRPMERVLFSPRRNANPFFHLMESLWMLSGRNDMKFPVYFNKNYIGYSDNGETQHGAYGFRWRKHWRFDQLAVIINELKQNPTSRRAVLSMWDPTADLHALGGADVPCNTQVYFDRRNGELNMTVCCRSNDIIWGCYGANAVHLSILQEYVATSIGVPVGVYRQFSNNWHMYLELYPQIVTKDTISELAMDAHIYDPYSREDLSTYPLMSTDRGTWDFDLDSFMREPTSDVDYNDPFFGDVAAPMYLAWHVRKCKTGDGLRYAKAIQAADWRRACIEWIERAEAKRA